MHLSFVDPPQPLQTQMLAEGTLTDANASWQHFGGGVSSDVYLVGEGDGQFVVKQVLEKLRVRDDWHADTARLQSEIDFLRLAGQYVPGAFPCLLAVGAGYFVMEYMDERYRNWKSMLMAGEFDTPVAARAGEILGSVHRFSSHSAEVERMFPNHHLFQQLRIEPYLMTTATRTPALRERIEREALRLGSTHECLIHGDYSPKNMLVGEGRVVVLDCETASYGDPAFDLAFLLTHLLLKGLYHSPNTGPAEQCARATVQAYFAALGADEQRAAELGGRTARLLQMILLARVDGKSPAEYLTTEHGRFIRAHIYRSLLEVQSLDDVIEQWFYAASRFQESA